MNNLDILTLEAFLATLARHLIFLPSQIQQRSQANEKEQGKPQLISIATLLLYSE